MISYYENRYCKFPAGNISIEELHQLLLNPNQEPFSNSVELIKQLRLSADEKEQKRIKAKLPAFTPCAVLSTRDGRCPISGKIVSYSGFIGIDIDQQDNPGMTDAGEWRDWIVEKIPYVALSAVSARGKGVWCLFALREPERFNEYITLVSDYFMQRGISIDKSKSKNPTEIRYFSPDPGAILKDDYKWFPLTPSEVHSQPKQPRKVISQKSGRCLDECMAWVTKQKGYSLVDGQKHFYLFWLSYALHKNGMEEAQVYATIYENIFPGEQIHSNCISGGIEWAKSMRRQQHHPKREACH